MNHRRENDGRYGLSADMTLPCRCGHPLGAHAGSNPGEPRECLNEDSYAPMCTGVPCDCPSFRKARTK